MQPFDPAMWLIAAQNALLNLLVEILCAALLAVAVVALVFRRK